MGGVHLRRDSVLARFALGEIHFGGISDDGFWNGGILSYSQNLVRLLQLLESLDYYKGEERRF